MILVDYSGVAMAAIFSQKGAEPQEDLIRHLVLNTLRMYNVKYRSKYGKMVICCDGGSSWRKTVFAEYKAARKANREASDMDWKELWRIMNMIREEISENLPYKVVHVNGAEADDVIATLVETTQEFGCGEPVMIVSADKDFIQLQKYSNVSQFSPMTKKIVTDKNPRRYLLEHILRGDSGDGVPNVLSPDNVFVDPNGRQKPLKAKQVDDWCANYSKLDEIMDSATFRNYVRNRHCIDLSYIPTEVASSILDVYNTQVDTSNGKVLNYLIMKRCKQLISCVNDFFPAK